MVNPQGNVPTPTVEQTTQRKALFQELFGDMSDEDDAGKSPKRPRLDDATHHHTTTMEQEEQQQEQQPLQDAQQEQQPPLQQDAQQPQEQQEANH